MNWKRGFSLVLALVLLATSLVGVVRAEPRTRVIVRGVTLDAALSAVQAVDGAVETELAALNTVVAQVPAAKVEVLSHFPGVVASVDRVVEGAALPAASSNGSVNVEFNKTIGTAQVWQKGVLGQGVTVAILDTGIDPSMNGLKQGVGNNNRILAYYDALNDKVYTANKLNQSPKDPNGHGTHMAGIIANSVYETQDREYRGVAPAVNLVAVRVLDEQGAGTYASILRGLNWVIQNKATYNIRVVNLSIGAQAQTPYWADPFDLAVMAAWAQGIVVVSSVGNGGPDPFSVGVPGNTPYIITVGAFTDNNTPTNFSDDFIPPFSAAGPTRDGFVKPDVVAPGAHIISTMKNTTYLARTYPERNEPGSYFRMTGTSTAAAVTSGVVALMLSANPNLTPDEVKFRLSMTAIPHFDTATGGTRYSMWQQGMGRIWAPSAVFSPIQGQANKGLDIQADLSGTRHFAGLTFYDAEAGVFKIAETATGGYFTWDGSYTAPAWANLPDYPVWDATTPSWNTGIPIWSDGYVIWSDLLPIWSDGYVIWSDGIPIWSDGYVIWSDGIPIWSDGYVIWSDGIPIWSDGYVIWSDYTRTWSDAVVIWSDGIPIWSDGYVIWSDGVPIWSDFVKVWGQYAGFWGDMDRAWKDIQEANAAGVPIWSDGIPIWSDGYVIWSDGVVIWSDGIPIWSDGVVIWSDGVVIWSDGVVIWSDGPVIWSDGVFVWNEQTVIWSDSADPLWVNGIPIWSDGIPIWSDGTPIWSDGIPIWSDGVPIWSDNISFWTGGTLTWSDGTPIWSDGVPIWSDGTLIWSDGVVIWSDITPTWSDGIPIWSDGVPIWSDAVLIWSDGVPIWSDGYVIWSDGVPIWSDGTPIWSDTTLIWSDGTLIWSDGVPIWSDGVPIWSDAVLIWSDGVPIWSDGYVIWSDGTPIWSDGVPIWSDAILIWSDGTVIWSDGTPIWSDGIPIWSDGIPIWSDGVVIWSDGVVIWSDGIPIWSDGIPIWSDGIPIWSDGIPIWSDGIPIWSDGIPIWSDGIPIWSDVWTGPEF